jgi:hypothetical protein
MTKYQKTHICNKVILHWWHNLNLAYANSLELSNIQGENCEFCQKVHCSMCPLDLYYIHCSDSLSLWKQINLAIQWKRDQNIVKLISNFLTQIEKVSDKWINKTKDCSNCTLPHDENSFDFINENLNPKKRKYGPITKISIIDRDTGKTISQLNLPNTINASADMLIRIVTTDQIGQRVTFFMKKA